MCGRFALSAPVDSIRKHFNVVGETTLSLRYNIFPGQPVAAVRSAVHLRRELVMLRWGLVPFWAKDAKIGSRLINARAETLEEKPSFRNSFKKHRCLIPATGFYEWQAVAGEKNKQPYYIRMRDEGLFALAGLWDAWRDREKGENIESCAIITTEANNLLAPIHDRMPVILHPDQYDSWLNPLTDAKILKSMCVPSDPDAMSAYPVSGLCNNAANDSPDCIIEVK